VMRARPCCAEHAAKARGRAKRLAGWLRETPEVGGETVKDILAWVCETSP
jgi:hypothetical protein